MSTLHPTYKSQHYTFDLENISVLTYSELIGEVLVSRVDFLDEVFGLFDDDFVRAPIQTVDNRDWVPLSVLNPPRLKSKRLYLI